jgi:Family of unknown function (DUF6504)
MFDTEVLPVFPRAVARARASGHGQDARTGHVNRVYQEPVEVRLLGGRPVRFVWRGRLYAVLQVLGHQVADRPARETWQVAASPGENVPPVVYELHRDLRSGRWLLSRDANPGRES